MTDAITVEGVSVTFRVPHEQIGSLKEFAIRQVRRQVQYRELSALADVSLSIAAGEAFGLVGRNGAGKTTLLRLIARVMRPTAGRVRVVGNVAPLLDLAAGFHPELTGRENIFLNGTLLGHSRREMESAFDRIVEFSELADFVEAPVRTYSSGMVARLGFAVATAWQPDVLLIDELLSVGDEAFRRKCKARFEDYRSRGTTIVIVSHDLALIRSICDRAAWLDHGKIQAVGATDTVTGAYHES